MKKYLSKPVFVWLAAALCCLLWGSAFPAVKTGYQLLKIESSDTASIILFAGVRFFFAGILTILLFSLAKRKLLLPNKRAVKKIGILSVFQTVLQYLFFYLGLAFTSGERASIVNGTSVFFALLISALLFKMEKLSAGKIFGCVIGFAGVILVSLDAFAQNHSSPKGEIFILLSSVSYAFSSAFMKRYSKEDNPAMLSGYQFILGGAVMCAVALSLGGKIKNLTPMVVLLMIYLAFLSAIAYSLWSILLKYNPVSRVVVCSFMTPVFGYLLSFLLSGGEAQSNIFLTISALALVALGIFFVNYGGKNKENHI